MMVLHDASSDDDYWCSSGSSSIHETEVISIDTQMLWRDIAHQIKSAYRETHQAFVGLYQAFS